MEVVSLDFSVVFPVIEDLSIDDRRPGRMAGAPLPWPIWLRSLRVSTYSASPSKNGEYAHFFHLATAVYTKKRLESCRHLTCILIPTKILILVT